MWQLLEALRSTAPDRLERVEGLLGAELDASRVFMNLSENSGLMVRQAHHGRGKTAQPELIDAPKTAQPEPVEG